MTLIRCAISCAPVREKNTLLFLLLFLRLMFGIFTKKNKFKRRYTENSTKDSNALRNKLLRKLHSVTAGFLTFFLVRATLHEEKLGTTFRNALQQVSTPLHSVSPLSNFPRNF